MQQNLDYKHVLKEVRHLEHAEKIRLLEELKKMVRSTPQNEQKPGAGTWLGCLEDQTQILGDIVSPVLDENQWEVLAG